jgi:heptosyltransferase III
MLRNVLIFHQAALGDFVSTWPMLLGISRVLAQHRVMVVTHDSKGRLAQRVVGVEYRDAEAWHSLYGDDARLDNVRLDEPRIKLLGEASLVVGIFGQDRPDPWLRNVKKIAPQTQVAILRGRPLPTDPVKPIAEFLIDQLNTGFAALASASHQMLGRIRSAGLMPSRVRGNHVVLHPGAGAPEKTWPIDNFIQLATLLHDRNIPVRVTLGEVELERMAKDQIATLEHLAELVRPASYLDLLKEIQDARFFVGNDSGPGHLAAVVGVPTISIFGPASNAAVWTPMGPNVKVIQTDQSLASILADEVLQAMEL